MAGCLANSSGHMNSDDAEATHQSGWELRRMGSPTAKDYRNFGLRGVSIASQTVSLGRVLGHTMKA